jgi:DNA-binding NarL/FixJ family response regulator
MPPDRGQASRYQVDMPASVMTMPEATKAVQLHALGYSQPQIAQELGRSRKAVRTAFRQLGVKQRTNAESQCARARLKQIGSTPVSPPRTQQPGGRDVEPT